MKVSSRQGEGKNRATRIHVITLAVLLAIFAGFAFDMESLPDPDQAIVGDRRAARAGEPQEPAAA